MRMIDAEEAKRVAREYVANPYEVISACAVIDNTPTVDAVQVVRCRDCKHYHEGTGWCDKLSYFQLSDGEPCSPAESMDWKAFQEDDFCSYGERKEPDNDQQT